MTVITGSASCSRGWTRSSSSWPPWPPSASEPESWRTQQQPVIENKEN